MTTEDYARDCTMNITACLDVAKGVFEKNIFIVQLQLFCCEVPVGRRKVQPEYAHPITVGENGLDGGNVVVLSGVTVEDNSIIEAVSVVNPVPRT